MLKKLIAINHGHQHVRQQRSSFVDTSVVATVRDAVINIPSFSKILIGGFGNRLVPETLIEILSSSSSTAKNDKQSRHLTLLTNACVQKTPALKSLIHSGRVDKLVTSLESNKSENVVSIELVDTIKFTQLCSSMNSGGDYALIRSSMMDESGCHYWVGSSSGNFLMGKWARRLTIGQFDRIGEMRVKDDPIKLERIFVHTASQASDVNKYLDEDEENGRRDLSEVEPMVKRALLELANNDVVFFSPRVN